MKNRFYGNSELQETANLIDDRLEILKGDEDVSIESVIEEAIIEVMGDDCLSDTQLVPFFLRICQ